jgi:hypothetical protein
MRGLILSSFFSQTLPDTAVAVYKGVVSIPGQIADRGTEVRQQAQNDFGRIGDPISGSIVSAQWTIGAGFEFFGGMAGVISTPEHLYDAGSYHVRASGMVGSQNQQISQAEDIIFRQALSTTYNSADDLAALAINNPAMARSVGGYLLNEYGPSLSGALTGGALRGSLIGSSLVQQGMNPRMASGVGAAVGITNIYGAMRGMSHNVVNGMSGK